MLLNACLALSCVLSLPASSQGATPSNTLITNQAQGAYSVNDEPKTVLSNQDVFVANPAVTPSSISLYRYAGSATPDTTLSVSVPGYSTSGSPAGSFTPLAPPVDQGFPNLNLGTPLALRSSELFHAGDPIFIAVYAPDQNLRPNAADTITLEITASSGDTELLKLTETGPSTGVFTGYIQTIPKIIAAPVSYDGKLTVTDSSTITARYQDSLYLTHIVTAAAIVDPTGRVFESITGLPVDGATVTLVNAATGNPATVIGDDGVSAFPATVTTGSTVSDTSGRRYDFVPGGYRFPLIAPGAYRLVVTPPQGYKGPSTVADGALQSLAGAPYSLSSASRGETFTVNPGPILHIDIPLDPVLKGLWMEKSAGKSSAAVGDFVPFRMRVSNLDATHAAIGVVVTDQLPHGMRYQPGSLRMGGVAAGDPVISADGLTISIALGTMAVTETRDITYVTQVVPGAATGSVIVNRAFAQANGVTSNSASAQVAITEDFFSSSSFLMGTVMAGACGADGAGVEGVRIYLENGSYVISDKKGMFHFEGVRPGAHVVQLDLDSLPEGYQVLPCQENSRFAGRAFSQFVDLQGGAMWRVDFRVGKVQRNERTPEDAALVPAAELHPASAERAHAVGPEPQEAAVISQAAIRPLSAVTPETPAAEQPEETVTVPAAAETVQVASEGLESASVPGANDEQLPEFDTAWIENVQAGREWVWPPPVYYPSIPSTHIAIKHHPADKVTLKVNDEEVHPVLLEKVLKHPNGTVALSYWRGVHLLEGDNRIVAVIKPADNSAPVILERILHVSTSPVRAEIVTELSALVADGKKPTVIALRLFDKDDYPIREGMTGKFAISSPYETYVDPEKTKLNDLAVKEETKYIVGREGVTLIRLQPTNRTGEVIVTIPYANNREELYRAWLTPQKREWILVGLAEGTAGYNTVSGHLENLRNDGNEEQLYDNGRVAFFAKGTIQGKWLLTMAYDSAKSTANSGSSLFQTINPNSFYTLYGDNSQQQYDAASARKLYLKIERDQFYALFGDYNTGLTVTELSRYSRTLNGLKSEYQDKNYEFNVFASETGQSFTKDEIRGDGTSGLYRLTRKNIVLNSDKISIEVRDRFRSEVIVSTRSLTRYIDYTIDYDAGTIFFKEPIPSRDENFNPYYIVVDYETRDVGKESLNYGGRLGVKFLDEKVKTGFTYIHEDQLVGKGDSYGLDALWQVATGTRLKAEGAMTDTNFSGVKRNALAWLAEAEHRSAKLDGKVYYRELEEGFGLGQQAASEAGTRKAGVETTYRMSDVLTMNGQLYRQYNLATGGVRDLIEGKTSYTYLDYTARLGLRHVSDSMGDGSVRTSDQLTTGGSWLTLNKRLAIHLDHDQSIGGNSSIDFPTRTTFGTDLKVTEKTTAFAQQEFTNGAGATSNSTRLGLKSSPWEGGAFNSSMERNMRENGDRLFALFGLKQNWKLTDKLSLDAGLDRSQTISKSTNYSQAAQTGAISSSTISDDFTAVSVGNSYIEKLWNWNSRLEYRTATSEDKWGILTSFVGEPREGWGGRLASSSLIRRPPPATTRPTPICASDWPIAHPVPGGSCLTASTCCSIDNRGRPVIWRAGALSTI